MDEGKGEQGQGQARARASKGKGKQGQGQVRVRRQRQVKENRREMVMAQQACESLHSWGSHRKEGDKAMVAFYPDLLMILLTRSRARYLYYNSYSMLEVSKKKKKIKRMFQLVTGCAASYGSGKQS